MSNPTPEVNFDSLLPPAMAEKAEALGVKKANMDLVTMFSLAVLAGAFISLGAIFSTTVLAGASALPYGVARLLGGLVFTLGLILVIVGGAELFTGNNLIIMAFSSGKVTLAQLLRNWLVVYAGNFVGAILTAAIMFFTGQYEFGSGAIGLTALTIANTKVSHTFVENMALGIMCNALVCMAVWLCYSARSTTEKIVSIIPPIAAFSAAGFEHSIANMYFIPLGIFINNFASAEFWGLKALTDAGRTAESFAAVNWSNFFIANLLPVTVGNIIGGAVMVGLVYWFVYQRPKLAAQSAAGSASSGD